MSFLLNQLLPQRLGGRGQYAPQGPTDYQKRPVPNPNCPLERMKRVIGNGTLAEPSRARSPEALTDPYEDAVLEQAFTRRERWALDGVYARYHSLLYSVAFNVLRNAEDAQDCLHDALDRVWTKRVTYDVARGALRSFLVVCVRNQAISQQRTAARLARVSTKMDAESIGFEEPRIDDYVENRRLLRRIHEPAGPNSRHRSCSPISSAKRTCRSRASSASRSEPRKAGSRWAYPPLGKALKARVPS